MTYEASEISRHGGKPVELFKYEGTYANFFYTSGPVIVNFEGNDYLPISMKRSAVNNATQNDDNAEVTIDLPVSTPLVAIYGFQISPPQLFLTIYRGHNPGEFVRYWSGNVENIQVLKGTATIRVPSLLASALSADFPNVYFQSPCNHDLFDARCQIDRADWSVDTTIEDIEGKVITVAAIGTLNGKLVGGEILLNSGERRMIVSQTALEITINYPFSGANVDDEVNIAAGCDLAFLGDCKTKFNNTRQFGGFPFIPPKNVFASGLEPGKNVSGDPCGPAVFDGWDYEIWMRAEYTLHHDFFGPALYAHPHGGSGGGGIGGAIGDLSVFPPNTALGSSHYRRMNMETYDPGRTENFADNWGAFLDVGIVNFFGTPPPENVGTYKYYCRHWTDPFPGTLIATLEGPGNGDQFVLMPMTKDWRDYR